MHCQALQSKWVFAGQLLLSAWATPFPKSIAAGIAATASKTFIVESNLRRAGGQLNSVGPGKR